MTKLACNRCPATFPETSLRWRCTCGGTLRLEGWTPVFNPAPPLPGLWRYASSLPLERPQEAVSLGEGLTPLVERQWTRQGRVVRGLFKLDYLCPSGSYKDRGMTVLMNRLRELGITEVIEDSSGNAGAAMAAYAAATGIRCRVFVPDYTSEGKCTQIAAYGAQLVRVPGSRENTTRAAEEAATAMYYASHNWSPYFAHGVKTFALEIADQLGGAPDALIVPAGQGSLVIGAYLAFTELLAAGRIARLPRIIAVQSEHCAPLYEAWKQGLLEPVAIVKGETMAEGIASSLPVRGAEALAAVRATGGFWLSLSEKAIWDGFNALAAVGLYVEPTSAIAAAALEACILDGRLGPDERVAVLLSGSGLKATDKIAHLRQEM